MIEGVGRKESSTLVEKPGKDSEPSTKKGTRNELELKNLTDSGLTGSTTVNKPVSDKGERKTTGAGSDTGKMTVIMPEEISLLSDKHHQCQNHSIINSQKSADLPISSDLAVSKTTSNLIMNKLVNNNTPITSVSSAVNSCFPMSKTFPNFEERTDHRIGSRGFKEPNLKENQITLPSLLPSHQSNHQLSNQSQQQQQQQHPSVHQLIGTNYGQPAPPPPHLPHQLPCHPDAHFGLSTLAARCEGCGLPIEDRFMLQTTDRQCWHERCLVCAGCGCKLDQTCFIRNSQPYCRKDYESLISGSCNGCEQKIASSEMVMRVSDQIYHLNCFSCAVCRKVLRTGDQFVLIEEQLYCKTDYEKQFPQFASAEKQSSAETEASRNLLDSVGDSLSNQNSESSDPTLIDHFFKNENSNHEHENDQLKAENSDNELDSEPKDESDDENDLENSKDKNSSIQQKPCRKRVILTTQQRRAFKAAFDLSSKPCRKVREQLARDTGLSVRVVQVWFQNERAKVKKLAKRQQQQQHNHLETGLGSPHLLEDGQYSVFIPNEAGFLQPQLDGRFSSHLAQSNHIIHPEGGLYSLPPGLNDLYPVCSGPPIAGQPSENEFINPTSDFPQILDMKESEIYSSMKLANQIAHPIDKLYSMQNSYFTTS
ncbi:LIM homeobox transcription factor 1-beta-like isoform X2 [Convolutriloba macropyga]|uniref:LIM homeobox transcription factor 1-beta-like isoform X2 n=1 Tax=Convolutriloba macropyga TaxID=536237 RepID=UPI003F523964